MPLTLPGTGSFSFFKGPSLTTTPLISNNNELVNISALTTTATTSSIDLNSKTAATTETQENEINNDNIKSEKINPTVPTERRARSVDAAINRNRRDSNCSSRTSNKKPVWFKALMLRLQQTFFIFNNESDDQVKTDGDDVLLSQTRSSVDAVRQVVRDDTTNDDVLSSDSKNIDSGSDLLQRRKQGLCDIVASPNYDHFIFDNEIMKDPPSTLSSISSSSFLRRSTSIFEICARTPRHKTKEPEVLRQVGRFTIVREREDFDTIIFDQCHCLQKPCKYSLSGGVHPPSPPDPLPGLMPRPSQTRPRSSTTVQLHHHHHQLLQNSHSPGLTSRSGPPCVRGYSFYSQPPSISSSSRRSLPCLCSKNNNINNLTNNMSTKLSSPFNIIPPASTVRTSKVVVTDENVTSTSCRHVLPTSASSPNLMNVHNRSKNESIWNNNKLRPSSNISGGCAVRTKRPSIVNMHQEFLLTKRHSVPMAPMPSSSLHISLPSKFSISPQEPHTTISSHSGRKFEVGWYSSSAASSNSSSSSEFASSPASTNSAFSFASSSGTNSHSPTTTLSRQCSSTLSSKQGRKFEVTVLSSDN